MGAIAIAAVLLAFFATPPPWPARLAPAAPAAPIAAPAPAWTTDADCRAPTKPGETLQVVFRHEGSHLSFRCQSLTDWNVLRPLTQKKGTMQ